MIYTMKKTLLTILLLSASLSIAAETNTTWTDGTSIWYYPGGVQTAVPAGVFSNGVFVVTNDSRTIAFSGVVGGVYPTNLSDFVTLQALDDAMGSVGVLYASTNSTLVAGYYDARSFLPTHPNATITVSGVTNGQYLAKWVSNTGLVSVIRSGIAVITSRMRTTTPISNKQLIVKPELYILYSGGSEPELFETSQQITLTGTMTEYKTDIDCPTNVMVPADARMVIKWKAVTAANSPDWFFECGSNLVIAVRLPIAQGGGLSYVDLGTAQTITGQKTFSQTINGTSSNALAVGGTAAANIITNNDARSQTLSNTSVSNATYLAGVAGSGYLQTSLFDSTFFHVALFSTAYTLTNSVYVLYKWDTEIADLGNAFSANSYTCPSGGYYEFHFQGGGVAVASNGAIIGAIYTNSVGWHYAYGALSVAPSGLGQTRVPCFATGYLSSGTVVSAYVYLAGDAGPRSMSSATAGSFPVYFTGRRIR